MQMSAAFNRSVHLRQALLIQSNTGMLQTMRLIVQQDSLGGLWRGLAPTFIRNALGVGVYFTTLNKISARLRERNSGKMNGTAALVAGAVSRSLAVCMLCPLSVVKTRMETVEYSTKYSGIGNALRTIMRSEGPRGLFSGLVPAIVRDAPYSALYMLLYLRVKARLGHAAGVKNNVSSIEKVVTSEPAAPVDPDTPRDKLVLAGVNFVSGAFGGGFATLLTQPQDVIKTRMQLTQRTLGNTSRYGTIREAARRIFAEEGFYGFFRGASARILKRMLGSAVTWMIFEETVLRYEHLLHRLGNKKPPPPALEDTPGRVHLAKEGSVDDDVANTKTKEGPKA